MGLKRCFQPRSILFLLLLSTLISFPAEAEWNLLTQSPGTGASLSTLQETFRFADGLTTGLRGSYLNTSAAEDDLTGEFSTEPEPEDSWRLPLYASTSQYSFSRSFTFRGSNLEAMIPFRPFFCGAAVQNLEVKSITTDRTYRPTILRAGAGVGSQIPNKLLIAGGAFISSMDLLDRQFNAIALKANVTWQLAGRDAVLFSVVSPAAAFSDSGNQHVFDDLRLGVRYFHELFDGGPDFVADAYYYQNRSVEGLYGRGFSTSLVSPSGLWRIGYELAYTPRVGATHTVLVDFLVCFDLQNLLNGRNPLVPPPAPFSGGRNLERAPMIEVTPCGLLAACLSEMILRLDP